MRSQPQNNEVRIFSPARFERKSPGTKSQCADNLDGEVVYRSNYPSVEKKLKKTRFFVHFQKFFNLFQAWKHWKSFKIKKVWKQLKKGIQPAFGCVQPPKAVEIHNNQDQNPAWQILLKNTQ